MSSKNKLQRTLSSRNYAMIRVNKSLLSQLHKERIGKGFFAVADGVSFKAVLSRYVNYELENLCLRIHSDDERFSSINRMVKKISVDTEGILSAIDKGIIKLNIENEVIKLMSSPDKIKHFILEEYDNYDYHQPYRKTYYKINEYHALYEKMSVSRFDTVLTDGLEYRILTVDQLYSHLGGHQDFEDVMAALYGIEDASMVFAAEREIE
jgi:DNA mismatch repair ATPase MutS